MRRARIDPARDDVVAFARRGDDHEAGARGDASRQRRVEHALEAHLAEPRPEHADRLEDVRDAAQAAPGSDSGRDRVAEAEQVRDVRALRRRSSRGTSA